MHIFFAFHHSFHIKTIFKDVVFLKQFNIDSHTSVSLHYLNTSAKAFFDNGLEIVYSTNTYIDTHRIRETWPRFVCALHINMWIFILFSPWSYFLSVFSFYLTDSIALHTKITYQIRQICLGYHTHSYDIQKYLWATIEIRYWEETEAFWYIKDRFLAHIFGKGFCTECNNSL